MKSRTRVNRSRDRKIFAKTAVRTHKKNLPGHNMPRGGQAL